MAPKDTTAERRDPVLAARIPRDLLAAVDDLCAREGRTRSDVTRQAIAALLDPERTTTAA